MRIKLFLIVTLFTLLLSCTERITYSEPAELAPMILVDGGTFSPEEGYEVILSSFYIGKYEVTQASYEAIMGKNPSAFSGKSTPVESVNWFNAIEYCNRRSIKEGLTPVYTYYNQGTHPDNWQIGWDRSAANSANIICDWEADGYRLPTEMEWMWAAMGGNKSNGYVYSGSDSPNEVAWHHQLSGHPRPVGSKKPNELGIYDMSGNAAEWCWDTYGEYPDGSFHNPTGAPGTGNAVVRGGSVHNEFRDCAVNVRKSFSRTYNYPEQPKTVIGFRVVRSRI